MSVAPVLEEHPVETGSQRAPLRLVTPQMRAAFGYVKRENGAVTIDRMPDYYRVTAIEEGTIDRARELARGHEMRHCFNEESIIKALEKSGEAFGIAKIQILPDEYLATAPHPERAGFYMMVPEAQNG